VARTRTERKRLGEGYVFGIVLRPALGGEEVVVPAPGGAGEAAADPRPVLVHGALARLDVKELAARREDLILLVAQDPLTVDLLRVLLTYVRGRLADALAEPPDVGLGDRRSRIRAAVGGTFGAVVAGRARALEYPTPRDCVAGQAALEIQATTVDQVCGECLRRR
jgi:hypothetical protein